tara:strand:+ start:6584 stop:7759 length:1176 start_codon:yes stop_codon:yes gene_type:complete
LDQGELSPDAPGNKIATTPKKIFLCFSLRIHVLRDAKILARRFTEMSDLVFAADAEMMTAIAPEIQVNMLESLARFEIEAFERARAVSGPRSPEAAALDLRREEALQATLRHALYLGDREVARRPLHHVAAHLGLELDEADENWTALAYEATKLLLYVSQERSRRQQGIYDQPTVFFRRAVNAAVPIPVPHQTDLAVPAVGSAAFAAGEASPTPAPIAPASFATEERAPSSGAPPADRAASGPEQQDSGLPGEPSSVLSSVHSSTAMTQAIVPAGFDLPDGYDEQSWQKARIAARPPNILVDRKLLSDQSRAALEKQRGITLIEAIELYFELLSLTFAALLGGVDSRDLVDMPNYRAFVIMLAEGTWPWWPETVSPVPVDIVESGDNSKSI